jgi:voltage-gated potassium channel
MNRVDNSFLEKSGVRWLITCLIIYSIACFSVETLPALSPNVLNFLHYSEIVVVAIFTTEYLLRIYLADNKFSFIFSFQGLIDLLAIVPFFLPTALDFRTLRILRLLRLARVLKLSRYNKAANRFSKALSLAKEELVIAFFAIFVLFYLSAFGIYHFESEAQPENFSSIFDALWWSIVTLTTVGYGDIYPITALGKFFTTVVLLLGLGLIAIPTGIITAALTSARDLEEAEIDVKT